MAEISLTELEPPPVAPPTVPGHYARVASTTGGYNRISTTPGGYQRKQVTGGYYWRRDNTTSSFTAENYALFSYGITTLAEAQAFIQRFLNLIDGTTSMSAAFEEYLTTEGYRIADADVDGEGSTLNERHLLYWLDHELKRRKKQIGYVNRLSEAGWGEAAPDNRADADPFDLWSTLNALGCNVLIVDIDAVDDATASSNDGPVTIPRGGTTCYMLNESTPKSASGGSKLTATSDTLYRYQLIGGKGLYYLNEANGGHIRFPLSATRPAIWLVRNTATKHVVNVENQIGITTPGQQQAPYVLVCGYPGEWPEIWCGNSTDSDVTPTDCPNAALSPTNATATIFRVGQAAGKYRNNFHWRSIHFHGKRQTAGGNFIFAQLVLDIKYGTGCSIRHCKGTDCQPMRHDDADAAGFPEYVDWQDAFTVRSSPSFAFLNSSQTGVVIDSNYIQPAPDDFPLPLTSETDILGFTVTLTGSDQRFTRNRIDGRNIRSPLRLLTATRPYVADNSIEAPYYKIIYCFECTDPIIERNYLYGNGGLAGAGEAAGLDLAGSNGAIVRHNVIWVNETIIDGASCIFARPGETASGNADLLDDAHVYGNILFGAGIQIGYASGWDDADGARNDVQNFILENNVIHEFAAANSAVSAAPVRIKLDGTLQANLGNAIRNNNITRDNGTAAIKMRTSHITATDIAVTDTVDGITGNTADAVTFADSAGGDFRITNNGPWSDWFPADMPFNASLSKAWTPD